MKATGAPIRPQAAPGARLAVSVAVRRRVRLLPVLVALCVRFAVLTGDPLGRPVPPIVSGAFAAGAAVLVVTLLWLRPWPPALYACAGAAIAAPYAWYVVWLLTWIEVKGIVVATITDLLLVAWLVSALIGRQVTP